MLCACVPYPAVVVRWRSLYDGADEEGLIAIELLLTSYDTEAQTPRCAPAQHDVLTAVQMSAGDKQFTLSHRIAPSARQITSIRPNASFSMFLLVTTLTLENSFPLKSNSKAELTFLHAHQCLFA